MELQDIAVWTAILVAGGALAFLAFGRRGTDVSGQLTGRLEQLAAQQAASQNALSERLQAQERALAAKLDERLGSLQDRVGQTPARQCRAGRPGPDRPARAAGGDRRRAEEHRRAVEPGGGSAERAQQQAGARRLRRGAAAGHRAIVSAGADLRVPGASCGGKRVDCLLTLPNPPGCICIDAKFPLESYRALREAKDEIATAQARRDFTTAIRLHVRAIAEKYIVPGETADSALMFLPSEAVYAELHASFPNLVDEAGRARVWIVSPTTLMATLTTIRAVLKDVRMREQAHIIQKKVGELGLDVNRLGDRVDKLQRHFGQVVEDVRQVAISSDKIAQKAAAIKDVELGPTDGNITQIPEQPALARLN